MNQRPMLAMRGCYCHIHLIRQHSRRQYRYRHASQAKLTGWETQSTVITSVINLFPITLAVSAFSAEASYSLLLFVNAQSSQYTTAVVTKVYRYCTPVLILFTSVQTFFFAHTCNSPTWRQSAVMVAEKFPQWWLNHFPQCYSIL